MQAGSNLIQMNATCLFYEFTAFHSFKIQDFILISNIHSLHTHTHTPHPLHTHKERKKGEKTPPPPQKKKPKTKNNTLQKWYWENYIKPKRSEMAIQQLN